MKLYVKGFYGYKNFGDEVILFGLLNFLQKQYNPEKIVVEVWDLQRIQSRVNMNLEFLDQWVLDKLDFVENSEISKRFRQILSILWFGKYRDFFKVFGGWEVLDESRKFPHDGRNLAILHHKNILKKQFILVGGIWKNSQNKTKFLFKFLLPKAQKIYCREKTSLSRASKYGWDCKLIDDFCTDALSRKKIETKKDKKSNILINISPKYFCENNLKKIENFVWNASPDCDKIFFPADINLDKDYYSEIIKNIPNLQIYDRTKHKLVDTINLFENCVWWIWSRLHFLYPLKYFWKDFESLSDSDKIKKNI